MQQVSQLNIACCSSNVTGDEVYVFVLMLLVAVHGNHALSILPTIRCSSTSVFASLRCRIAETVQSSLQPLVSLMLSICVTVQDASWRVVDNKRAKGWKQLSSKLARTVDELYLVCELESHTGHVGELLEYFNRCADDFNEVRITSACKAAATA